MRGFKNFLMQGDLIVVAVALSIALAFSTLIKSFTDAVIVPLVNAAGGGGSNGLGFRVNGELVDIGTVIAAIIYFVVFVAVVYFAIVVPYRHVRAKRGETVFGDPAPTKTCPHCLSDVPAEASKCKFCTSPLEPKAPPA
jgi:large conductance mechanosensitive channel